MATGTIGSLAYLRSGHLRERQTLRVAVLMLATAIVGTPGGVLLNSAVSSRVFGVLLAGFVVLVAVLVWYWQRRAVDDGLHPRHPTVTLIVVGLLVAVASGMFGVGVPQLGGVLVGWKIARTVPARYLRRAIIIILIAIAPILVFNH